GYASQNEPYESGYDHSCDDAGISDSSDRYINQPGKGPSFHADSFMNGYNNGFDSCSDGIGDDSNAESNAVDGNLRVIATLEMGTYGNQYCDTRTFDMLSLCSIRISTRKDCWSMRWPRNNL
ncbi:MAG: hypothetical protein ACRD8Z_02670, partial [Nitrososphaeraceae archaeon]